MLLATKYKSEPIPSFRGLPRRSAEFLGWIEHQANQPLREAAKALGIKEYTAHYTLQRLKDLGVVQGMAPVINVYPLGFFNVTFYLSLSAREAKDRAALMQLISSHNQVSWIGELGGEYDYGVAITVREIEEAQNFVALIQEQFGEMLFRKTVSFRLAFTAYGRKYLAGRKLPKVYYGTGFPAVTDCDLTDYKILSLLSNQRVSSYADEAKKLGVSLSTFERRIKRLEQLGIINGWIYFLSLAQFGAHMHRLLIFSRGDSRALLRDLGSFCEEHPQVLHLIHAIGEWDFEIGIETYRAETARDISQQLLDRFGKRLRDVKLLQIFRHVKYSSFPMDPGKILGAAVKNEANTR